MKASTFTRLGFRCKYRTDSQLALRLLIARTTQSHLRFILKEVSGPIPTLAALRKMRIFSDFMDNIGEGKRWPGRTQSSISWSPEQLQEDLRRQVESTLPNEVPNPIAQKVLSNS